MKLKAMLKRDMHLFLRELIPALILAAVLICICTGAMLAMSSGSDSAFTPIKVSFDDEEKSLASKVMTNLIRTRPFIATVLDISEAESREEAIEDIRSGGFGAAIILPDGYYHSVARGQYVQGEIIISESKPLYGQMLTMLANIGERLISAGQYGIFSGQEVIFAMDGDNDELMDDYLDEVNALFVNHVLKMQHDHVLEERTDYAGSSVGLVEHYALCYFALFIEMCTLFFSRLFSKDCTRSVLTRLRSCGVGDSAFLTGKVLYPLVFRAVCTALIFAAVSGRLEIYPNPGSVAAALAAMILSTCFGSLLMICFAGSDSGVSVLCAISAAGLILKGGVIPLSMLPAAMRTVGSLTPLGVTYSCLSLMFGGNIRPIQIVFMALYCAALYFLVRRKIAAVIGGRGGGR